MSDDGSELDRIDRLSVEAQSDAPATIDGKASRAAPPPAIAGKDEEADTLLGIKFGLGHLAGQGQDLI